MHGSPRSSSAPDRLRIGLGASKIFMRHIGEGGAKPAKPVRVMRESMEIIRAVMAGEEVNYEGESFSAHVPALRPDAESARGAVPVYPRRHRTARCSGLAGRAADGLLTASITTPDFVRYTWDNVREGAAVAGRDPETIDVGCTLVSSIGEDEESGRDGAREIAAMYLANKVQNIQGAAEVLLQKAHLEPDEIRPVAEAMERGGRLAAKAAVTDAILDKCKPIAGTPTQCIDRILEYKEAGCNHIMLEMWGSRPRAPAGVVRHEGPSRGPQVTALATDLSRRTHRRSRHRLGSSAPRATWSTFRASPARNKPRLNTCATAWPKRA